jgi:predicted small secreted protein
MTVRAAHALLLTAALTLAACGGATDGGGKDTDGADTVETDEDTDDTDDTQPDDTDDTQPDDTDDTDVRPDTDLGEVLGCTGGTGDCSGLTGNACQFSDALGCDVLRTLSCSQQVYCIAIFDGCPVNYCTGSGDTCAWRDPADRLVAQSCSNNTAIDSCNSPLCRINNYNCSATGTWSCDITFTPDTGPTDSGSPGSGAQVCTNFAALGFGCTPLYAD